MDQKQKKIQMLTLALGIAALPPLWAVLAPYLGVTTGAVALICAGVFVANGNHYADAPRICIGFLLGDLWAAAALKIMDLLELPPDAELYLTLFILGFLAVVIGSIFSKIIYLPSWLCGWAIGLTIMAPVGVEGMGTLPIQIGAAMIAGVVYVGIGVDLFQKALLKCIGKICA